MVDGTREFILVQSSNNPTFSPGWCSADLCIGVVIMKSVVVAYLSTFPALPYIGIGCRVV